MRAAVAVALGAVVFVSPAAAEPVGSCRVVKSSAAVRVPSASVAARLERGEAVDLEDKLLDGDLVLRPGSTVAAPFRCRGCWIRGDLVAEDVDFGRTVDLGGTTVDGDARLQRARFVGLALFDSIARGTTTFDGETNFSQARFLEGASFRGAVFRSQARFDAVRALDDVSFADACFDRDAHFGSAAFAGEASFQASKRDLSFRRADFAEARFAEAADFRGRRFRGDADFERASFRGTSDLSRTEYARAARFDEARFTGAVSFLAATFHEAASFVDSVADDAVDFTSARFLADARFFDFTSGGVLTIDGRELGGNLVVSDDTTVRDVRVMDFGGVLAALDRYGDRENEERFLTLIESAAKERDDLGLANDARYERRKLIAEGYGSEPLRLGDYVFYRGVAGYLVRPLHPLVTLLFLALVFAAIRRYRVERVWAQARGRRLPARLRFARVPAAEVAGLAGDTVGRLRLVGRSASDGDGSTSSTDRLAGVERWTYRLLLVLAALALANSNPTLRQMFDALT